MQQRLFQFGGAGLAGGPPVAGFGNQPAWNQSNNQYALLITNYAPMVPLNLSETIFRFGPSRYGENWNITRMTSRAQIFAGPIPGVGDPFNPSTLPLPTVKVWRGAPGGFLLDKYDTPVLQGAVAGTVSSAILGDAHSAISETAIDVKSGETLAVQFTWSSPPTLPGLNQFAAWGWEFYIEGEMTFRV